MTERAEVKLMLKSATGQTLCRHVAAVRKIVPKRAEEETQAETGNSSEEERRTNIESLPQDTPVPATIQTQGLTPRVMQPVISVTKQRVEDIPQPKKRETVS